MSSKAVRTTQVHLTIDQVEKITMSIMENLDIISIFQNHEEIQSEPRCDNKHLLHKPTACHLQTQTQVKQRMDISSIEC